MVALMQVRHCLSLALPRPFSSKAVPFLAMLLQDVPFVRELGSDLMVKQMMKKLDFRHYSAGDVLFEEGEFGDCMFFLLRGEVRLDKRRGVSEISVCIASTSRKLPSRDDRPIFALTPTVRSRPRHQFRRSNLHGE